MDESDLKHSRSLHSSSLGPRTAPDTFCAQTTIQRVAQHVDFCISCTQFFLYQHANGLRMPTTQILHRLPIHLHNMLIPFKLPGDIPPLPCVALPREVLEVLDPILSLTSCSFSARAIILA